MNFFRRYLYLPITWILWGRPVPYAKFDEYERELDKICTAVRETGGAYVRVNGKLCLMYQLDRNGGMGSNNIVIEEVEEKNGNA